jgi:hypothetical protein
MIIAIQMQMAECEAFAEQNEAAEPLVALNATLRRLSVAL